MKKSVIEAMKARRSIRSYSKRPMHHAAEGQLQDYLRHIEHPFDARIRVELIKSGEYPGHHRASGGSAGGLDVHFLHQRLPWA